MNYFRSKNTNLKKFLNKKTSVAALILVSFFSIFSSYFVQSQGVALPDCSNFSGNPEPGGNCLIYGKPLCQNIPSAPYAIDPSSILSGATPNHRANCADISDLPLCEQMDDSFNPIKDCVKECSDAAFDGGTGDRGVDFAVHNRDCVRFCDAPEAGITADPGTNCIGRTCHQLPAGVNPQPGINCELRVCNLLTADELSEVKFDNDAYKYCEGSTVKCYEFNIDQLTHVKLRAKNQTCNVHNCRVAETCVPHATDDMQKILDKVALDPAYRAAYEFNAFFGYEIENDTMCSPVNCLPVFYRQYRCTPMEDANPVIANVNCDEELNCPGGYCKKKIDCNLPANVSVAECSFSTSAGATPTVDDTNSWFYRPEPKGGGKGALGPGATIRTNMQPQLCYTRDNMEDNGWGKDIPIFGYFHWDNISPGKCSTTRSGFRGNGYGYLCGANGLIYNMLNHDAAFFKGYANSTYTENGGTHSVQVCLRYNNFMHPQKSCGSRECTVVCAFNTCTQSCGSDKCKTLTIDENAPRDCMMNGDIFTQNSNKSCMQKIEGSGLDSHIRLRAVKYGRYICSFVDFKGTLAYSGNYYNGGEKLSDGTCLSGDNVNGSCSGSKNTNDSQGFADVWRTVMMVHYIDDNRPSGPKGYLDRGGRLFKEQECPKVAYRVSTPKHFNLANLNNSPNLFTPPIYIMNARIKKGAAISYPTNAGGGLGATDFHYPEIEVRFGTTTQKLSLDIDYTGYEPDGSHDPYSRATITTTVDNFDYTAETFVRKEQTIDSGISNPIFCLYRRIQDSNGAYITPLRIGCVSRKFPEIDNAAQKLLNPLIDFRRALISPDSSTTFASPKIAFRYLSSSNITSAACGTPGVNCTAEVLLENPDQESPNCYDNIESRKICVQREECSRLNIECTQNEIAMNNAQNANLPIDSFLAVRRNCNEVLLPLCNSKKGLSSVQVTSVTDYDYNAEPINPKLYGWHNEMCITSGFEGKLKNVLAHQISPTSMGKCEISDLSPYLNDNDPSTNCDSGGKAPNCLCVEGETDVAPPVGFEVRLQTLREAGLCIDIPLPKTCAAIDYNQSPNPTINDLEYVLTSLNNNAYGSGVTDINGKVHISHRYRSEGKAAPSAILLRGHAEFPTTVFGVNDVSGQCKGFWTYKRSAGGNILMPKLNCLNNGGNAVWESSARDACVRFKCDEVYTAGPDATGVYQGTYGVLETGENKGLSHGFALWTAFTKTNDFLESTTANACITGFKRSGATAVTANGSVTGANAVTASLYQLITGYSGGTLPTRQCNQIGQWQAPTNACQRITCPAVTPPTPANAADSAAWELWRNSGGATFPSVNASRSDLRVQPESISTGTCNESLGFFKSPGGASPTRKCDHLGNWLPVENPCVTTCDAISNPIDAANFNNGFAFWDKVSSVFDPNGVEGTFLGCLNGYVTNPYPPATDVRGNPYPVPVNDDYLEDFYARPAENPRRLCAIGSPNNLGLTTNVWTSAVNGCINQCPGFAQDPRISIGLTKHPTSQGQISIQWPATDLGQYAYVSNFNNVANLDASYFEKTGDQPRSSNNTYYLLRRYCGTDGKWQFPETTCAANNGQIGNARYDKDPLISGGGDAITTPIGGSAAVETVTGTCITNYWKHDFDRSAAPQRGCFYEDANLNIDQVYLGLVNGFNDCEERRCPARAATLGDRSSTPAISLTDSRTIQGAKVLATCLNNQTNKSGVTIFSSIIGNDSSPYIECLSNGVWSDFVDENKCQLGCDFSALDQRVDSADCKSGDGFTFNAYSLQSGQTIQLNLYSGCSEGTNDCDAYRYFAKCVDGTKYLYQDYVHGGAIHSGNIGDGRQSGNRCPYSSFNQSTNTWNRVTARGYCDVCHDAAINGVSGQYINKYNQSSSFSIQYHD